MLLPPRWAADYNLPNLAIFLWRLAGISRAHNPPILRNGAAIAGADPATEAQFAARFDLHPLGRPSAFSTRIAPIPTPSLLA